tara:strand:- start:2881 stop:3675 length:795 start_codon:yes stop_codon:yes gene_type:complete
MISLIRYCAAVIFKALLMVTFMYSVLLAETMKDSEWHLSQNADARKIELIIEEYLLENPEIIEKALQKLQTKRKLEKENRERKLISASKYDLYYHPGSPFIGRIDARTTIVEFFDYRCAYCKKVYPTIDSLLKQDSNIRIVLKEFPILGPESEYASRFALSAYKINPSTYNALHNSFMRFTTSLDRTAINKIALGLGLDVERIVEGINDPDIAATLKDNYQLAQTLGIRGTPAFVIGQKLIPGAISLKQFKELVEEAKKSCVDC